MNPSEQVALAWQSLRRTAALMPRAALWAPWVVVAAIQAAVLASLWWFAHPLLSRVMAPLVARMAGPDALHYPEVFIHLPNLYSQIDLLVVAIPGSVMLGAATRLFAQAHMGRTPTVGGALREALARAVPLVVIHAPFNLLLFAFTSGVSFVVGGRGGLVVAAAFMFVILGSVILQSLFLFVTALYMLGRHSIRQTFAGLGQTWRHGFWSALTLGVLLLVPLLPLHVISGQTAVIVARGTPEISGTLVALQMVVTLLVGFLLAGSATLVFLAAMPRRGLEEA